MPNFFLVPALPIRVSDFARTLVLVNWNTDTWP